MSSAFFSRRATAAADRGGLCVVPIRPTGREISARGPIDPRRVVRGEGGRFLSFILVCFLFYHEF
jgi:hypothetical protein